MHWLVFNISCVCICFILSHFFPSSCQFDQSFLHPLSPFDSIWGLKSQCRGVFEPETDTDHPVHKYPKHGGDEAQKQVTEKSQRQQRHFKSVVGNCQMWTRGKRGQMKQCSFSRFVLFFTTLNLWIWAKLGDLVFLYRKEHENREERVKE